MIQRRASLNFALAGHNPPRWAPQRRLGSIARRQRRLAARRAKRRALPRGVAEAGRRDTVLFYTDGVTEAPNSTQIQFGLDGLDNVLRGPQKTAADLLDALREALDEFTGGQPPEDDRTVLAVRVTA